MEISFEDGEVTYGATMEGDQSNLTFDKLLEARAELKRPKLYYSLLEFVSPGNVLLVSAGDYHPEYIAIQPDDFAYIKDELGLYRTLIPLADYRPAVTEMSQNDYILSEATALPLADYYQPAVTEMRPMMKEAGTHGNFI